VSEDLEKKAKQERERKGEAQSLWGNSEKIWRREMGGRKC